MPAYRDMRTGAWRYRKWIRTPEGKRIRITGTPATDTKAAAEAAERAHIERVMHPERVQAAAAKAASERKELPRIETFAERFLKEYLPRQKPSERYHKERALYGALLPFFGHLRLDEIDQSHVNAWIAAQTTATSTINNRLAVLSTLLRYAGPSGCKLIPACTLSFHIDSMSAEIVAVPADDVRKLLEACTDERYRVAVLLAAEAGLRIGEIRGLHWTDIKSGRMTIRRAIDQRNNVTAPKHNKMRTVPLSPALAEALARLPRRGLWVISRREDGGMLGYYALWEAIRALYVRAGVAVPVSESGESMPWHSLRHTFGTECAARGVPLPTLKELMGHSDIATTMRYVTVTGRQLDAAIALAFGPTERQPVGNGSEVRA